MSVDEREGIAASWIAPDPGGSRRMGMGLFLVSLAMLFGASVAAFAFLRLTSPALQGSEPVELPLALFASTAALLVLGMMDPPSVGRGGLAPLMR